MMVWKLLVAIDIAAILAVVAAPIEPWMQLGGMGIMGAILWYLVVKVMPQRDIIHRESLESLAKSHDACSERIDGTLKAIKAEISGGRKEQYELLKHALDLPSMSSMMKRASSPDLHED